MAELITFLIALPVLYGIGRFYYRLGGGLCRSVRELAAAVAADREAGGAPRSEGHRHDGR
jgi:hypothetical protein